MLTRKRGTLLDAELFPQLIRGEVRLELPVGTNDTMSCRRACFVFVGEDLIGLKLPTLQVHEEVSFVDLFDNLGSVAHDETLERFDRRRRRSRGGFLEIKKADLLHIV